MKKILGILALLILCYYGVTYHRHMNEPTVTVDERLVPIVNEWIKMMESEGIQYENTFNRLNCILIVSDSVVIHRMHLYNMEVTDAVAISDPKTKSIIISETQANKGGLVLKATVWHELGHSVYGIGHVEGYYLMNEYTYTEKEYTSDWDKLKANYLLRCKNNERYTFY